MAEVQVSIHRVEPKWIRGSHPLSAKQWKGPSSTTSARFLCRCGNDYTYEANICSKACWNFDLKDNDFIG